MERVITLLNNADGFSKEQMETLNSVLLSSKKRFNNKAEKIEIPLTVSSAVKESSGVVSGNQSYQYGGYLFQVFYLDASGIPLRKRIKVFTLNGKPKVASITGNSSIPPIEVNEAGVYFDWEFEENGDVFVTKVLNTDSQFRLIMKAVMEIQ